MSPAARTSAASSGGSCRFRSGSSAKASRRGPHQPGLHQYPTPRLGGLAILVAVAAAVWVFLPGTHERAGILVGAGVIALVGAFDDVLELTADFKLVGQLLAAIAPVATGVRVEE